jgi:hypothetical protein
MLFTIRQVLHAAACVVLALVRILFISITVQKDGFDNEPEPTLSIMGFRWFFTYALVLTLFHHFFLLNLEVFSFSEIQYTLSTCCIEFNIYCIFNAYFRITIFQKERT